MRLNTAIRASIACALLVTAWAFAPRNQQSSPAVPPSAPTRSVAATLERQPPSDLPATPATTQRVYAPLPKGSWVDADLVLNNNSPAPMTVTSTFYRDGSAQDHAVALQPAEVRWVKLRELIAPLDPDVTAPDGVELSYLGHTMELGAQIVLIRRTGSGTVDVPFTAAAEYQTRIQEAVWPSTSGARSVIVVGNAADVPVFVTIQRSGDTSEEIELAPHASRTLIRDAPVNSGSSATAEWMRMDVRGPVGSLRAIGFVEIRGRFVAGIRFHDPGAMSQSSLFATNIRIADAWPTLALKNTSAIAITATPRFLPFDPSQNALDLAPLILGPHAAALVNLKPLLDTVTGRPDLAHLSVQVLNTGGAGTLIGGLSAISRDGARAYDVPLRDSGPTGHATGSYPWRIDGDYNTVISITNVSGRPAKYHARITYPGGVYWFAAAEIPIAGTAIFDLRELRDRSMSDMHGHTLPKTLTGGQFRWSSVLSQAETQLTGRAEIISAAVGQSSSYSCWVCCPDGTAFGYLNPTQIYVNIADRANTGVNEHWHDCYGNPAGEYPGFAESWSVGSPDVTSVETVQIGLASARGISDGSSSILGLWSGEDYTVNPDTSECVAYAPTLDAPGNVTVICGDERDSMKGEYAYYNVALSPKCPDFTFTKRSAFFSFGELNTGDYSWALVRDPLIAPQSAGYGLDAWRGYYGSSRIINSSYRNPARNFNLNPPGAQGSRHMFGDAADLRNQSGSVDEWNAMVQAAYFANADYVEPQNLACGLACTHADWRGHAGSYR